MPSSVVWPTTAVFQSMLSKRRAMHLRFLLERHPTISIHALQAESDSTSKKNDKKDDKFQSTLSKRRATSHTKVVRLCLCPFQSTLSKQRATLQVLLQLVELILYFNPRSPSGERLKLINDCFFSCANFNPRSPSGERLTDYLRKVIPTCISIHALQAESDCIFGCVKKSKKVFQSTLSKLRATRHPKSGVIRAVFQSTLSKRRATKILFSPTAVFIISIHALQAESDASTTSYGFPLNLFQSTLSKRRATMELQRNVFLIGIFQSTLSKRRTTLTKNSKAMFYQFQSTLSKRRATRNVSQLYWSKVISIHALQAESDELARDRIKMIFEISIHALQAESDIRLCADICNRYDFNPRSPSGERHPLLSKVTSDVNGFQSTLSKRRAT